MKWQRDTLGAICDRAGDQSRLDHSDRNFINLTIEKKALR